MRNLETVQTDENFIGEGRSGSVYLEHDAYGRPVARKIFRGSTLARLVNIVLLGGDNPYVWSLSAIKEAACRRRILAELVAYWMPQKLRVARPYDARWDAENSVNELTLEFIDGRAAGLHQPFSRNRDIERRDLVSNVMKPLSRRLIECGFEGMVWQAGYGNPVAASNFLLESDEQSVRRWVWVDLESGVPALFPLYPNALFRFYLPQAFRRGRPMFDDVDIEKLSEYVESQKTDLIEQRGMDAWLQLQHDIAELRDLDDDWRDLVRLERSIRTQLAKGRIDEAQADWYRSRPVRWYTREFGHLVSSGIRRVARRLRDWLSPARFRTIVMAVGSFLGSSRFRAEVARKFVSTQVTNWASRKQLSESEAAYLQKTLRNDEASLYITDFGIHLAIKPAMKMVAWLGFPALYAFGMINETVLLGGVMLSGAIGRTLYTVPRIISAMSRGAPQPWLALFVGVLPVIGNIAFPIQLLYAAKQRDNPIAQFLIYDTFTRVGRILPIWGGNDSLVEHWTNSIGNAVIRHIRLGGEPVLLHPEKDT